jgi:hypothetical protein
MNNLSLNMYKNCAGFEVFSAASIKMAVFWVVAPCTRLHGSTTQKTAVSRNCVHDTGYVCGKGPSENREFTFV